MGTRLRASCWPCHLGTVAPLPRKAAECSPISQYPKAPAVALGLTSCVVSGKSLPLSELRGLRLEMEGVMEPAGREAARGGMCKYALQNSQQRGPYPAHPARGRHDDSTQLLPSSPDPAGPLPTVQLQDSCLDPRLWNHMSTAWPAAQAHWTSPASSNQPGPAGCPPTKNARPRHPRVASTARLSKHLQEALPVDSVPPTSGVLHP